MLYKLGHQSRITSDLKEIEEATKLILPGVGAFDRGMQNLHDRGFTAVLNKRVLEDKVPVLGICLGMQLMTLSSEEGSEKGLGWIDAECLKFRFEKGSNFKVPHMGWNYVTKSQDSDIIGELDRKYRYYFVHSYYVKTKNSSDDLFTTDYGMKFTSAFKKDNITGVQFHPEKSHKFGMELLNSFATS